jgi:sulfide:quinone oxidoreductase
MRLPPRRPELTTATEKARTASRARILIIGGGTAGITVAARLSRAGETDITLIEPSTKHYYQPLWTLVGAGQVAKESTVREEAGLIPKNTRWIQDRAVEIDPERQLVRLGEGTSVAYDFLVVAPGIQIDWDAIPGLREALDTPYVSSNFDYDLAPKTWEMIRTFRGGNAVFSNPGTPIKCAGAPQKIMYLAADHLRRTGVASANVIFGHAGGVMFGVPEFRAALERTVDRYAIDVHFKRELIEVRADTREAIFRIVDGAPGTTETIPYDILHAVPPMSAPDFLKGGPLAGDDRFGWVKVDRSTLQSPDYPNVFSLGDASSLPTSKTGAAIRKQAPVLVANLLGAIQGREPHATYDGYSSCPLLTARRRMLLAEFDYEMKWSRSIPFLDTSKERYDMYLLKRYGLPWMYWNLMLKGRA